MAGSENVQVEQIPDEATIKGVMRIVARHHYSESGTPDLRDVYLLRVSGGSQECMLWHTMCPLSLVRSLEFIGRLLAAEIVYDPPGNGDPGWKWPDPTPAAPAIKADSALDFS